MSTSISANMNLVIPGVGTEPGPQWASDLNTSLTLIDAHTHAPGFGIQIGTDGLNITSDLTINSTNLIAIRAARFTPQSAALALPADLAELYVVSNDLFYNDGTGAPIRITQNGSIVGTSGSISGLTPPASVSYAGGTFTFQSNVNTPGNIDGASFVLRNFTANSKGLTLSPPNAMASDYTITLPSLPSSAGILEIDASGNITASTSTFGLLQPSPSDLNNVGVLGTVAANALTVALKQADGTTDPTANAPVVISFRSATATSGSYTTVQATSGVSIIVPNGATLGLAAGPNQFIYVYALNNAGTIILGVSASPGIDPGTPQTTTAISGSSTSPSTLYTTTGHSGLAVRLIGRIAVNEASAGVYASAPTELYAADIPRGVGRSIFTYNTFAGYSTSPANNAAYFTNRTEASGNDIVEVSNSATGGLQLKALLPGIYSITYVMCAVSANSIVAGALLNASLADLAVDPQSVSSLTSRLVYTQAYNVAAGAITATGSWSGPLNAGDLINITSVGSSGSVGSRSSFSMAKIGNL